MSVSLEDGEEKTERQPKIWYLFPCSPVLLFHKLITYIYVQNSFPYKLSRSLTCENESFYLNKERPT